MGKDSSLWDTWGPADPNLPGSAPKPWMPLKGFGGLVVGLRIAGPSIVSLLLLDWLHQLATPVFPTR